MRWPIQLVNDACHNFDCLVLKRLSKVFRALAPREAA